MPLYEQLNELPAVVLPQTFLLEVAAVAVEVAVRTEAVEPSLRQKTFVFQRPRSTYCRLHGIA